MIQEKEDEKSELEGRCSYEVVVVQSAHQHALEKLCVLSEQHSSALDSMKVKLKEMEEDKQTLCNGHAAAKEALVRDQKAEADSRVESIRMELTQQLSSVMSQLESCQADLKTNSAQLAETQAACNASAHEVDNLHKEAQNREQILSQVQAELQQKETLLQQISMVAAPANPSPVLPTTHLTPINRLEHCQLGMEAAARPSQKAPASVTEPTPFMHQELSLQELTARVLKPARMQPYLEESIDPLVLRNGKAHTRSTAQDIPDLGKRNVQVHGLADVSQTELGYERSATSGDEADSGKRHRRTARQVGGTYMHGGGFTKISKKLKHEEVELSAHLRLLLIRCACVLCTVHHRKISSPNITLSLFRCRTSTAA